MTLHTRIERDLRSLERVAMLGLIDAASTPSDAKERIMFAREEGLITDAECEDWIAAAGLAGD